MTRAESAGGRRASIVDAPDEPLERPQPEDGHGEFNGRPVALGEPSDRHATLRTTLDLASPDAPGRALARLGVPALATGGLPPAVNPLAEVPTTSAEHWTARSNHGAFAVRALILGSRAALAELQRHEAVFAGDHGTLLGGDAVKWDAALQLGTIPAALVSTALAVKEGVDAGRKLRDQLATLDTNRQGHDDFAQSLRAADAAREARSAPEPLDAGQALAHLNYRQASMNAELLNRTMHVRAGQMAREMFGRLVGSGLNGFQGRGAFAANTFGKLAPAGLHWADAANGVTNVYNGATYVYQGGWEWQIAGEKVRAAGAALRRVEGLAVSDGQGVLRADLGAVGRKATEASRLAPPGAIAKQAKLAESIEQTVAVAGAHEVESIERVYGVVHGVFERNQVHARRHGKIERWFARVKTLYGVSGIVLGVVALGLLAAGAAATMGVLPAVVLGVGALYYAYSLGRGLWLDRRNRRDAARDHALLENAVAALDGSTGLQSLEAALLGDPKLQGNRYLAGHVLAAHLLDRSDLDLGTGRSRDHGSPAYLRRKLATRYLLASGMDRSDIRALKAAGTTSEGMRAACRVIGDHLYGGRARASMLEPGALFARLLRRRRPSTVAADT
jgi:hypothetical protein